MDRRDSYRDCFWQAITSNLIPDRLDRIIPTLRRSLREPSADGVRVQASRSMSRGQGRPKLMADRRSGLYTPSNRFELFLMNIFP